MAKESAKPVYALVGSDSFLQLQELADIVRRLPADMQRSDVDGERAELADVFDELRSFAMFGGAKLVVVRDADAFLTRFREPLAEYVASPSESSTLVLRLSSLPSNQRIYKAIAKTGEIRKCEPPSARDLPRWIVDRAKAVHKLSIAPDAAAVLADRVGDDLGRLDNELAKLAIQCDGGKVGADDVCGVAFQREQEMWHMTNQLAAGRADEALRRWRQLVSLDTSAEFRAVTWLAMWLENVRKALSLRGQGVPENTIANQLRIFPFEQRGPFFKTVNAMGEKGVRRAIDLLAEVDRQSKSGVGDAAENVERFILSLAGR